MDEIWKPVIGYESIYSISNLGRIRRDQKTIGSSIGKILKNVSAADDYIIVCLHKNKSQKNHYVHVLVAEAFIGPKPEGMQCNHIDGNKSNPNLKNLEYVTRQQNSIHARDNGLLNIKKGEDNYRSKLTNKQVIEIRNIFSLGNVTQRFLAKQYNVNFVTINSIVHRRNWKHI